MSQKFFYNLQLLDPEAAAPSRGGLLVDRGKIAARFQHGASPPPGAEPINQHGLSLAPGFIDLHFHGELIFAAERTLPSALARTAQALVQHGTTAFLATTVAWHDARIGVFATQCRDEMTRSRQSGAQLIGVHLEGPWISPLAAGAQPSAAIRAFEGSSDEQLLDSVKDIVKLVTLAPEIPGSAALLAALQQRSIVASLGHSLARQNELAECVNSGLTHVTHLFNAMGPIHHRESGVAGWALAEDRVTCDLICDGIHVHPAWVRTACRAKGDRLLLVTDRIDPPLNPSSQAPFGSGPLHDDGEAIRMEDGNLAGSRLSLDGALRNVRSFGGLSRLEAIAAATLGPARLLGLESERGSLRVGARADFAILDQDDRVCETWIAGERVFASC